MDIVVFYMEDDNGSNSKSKLEEEAAGHSNIQFKERPVTAAELKKIFLDPQASQNNTSGAKTSATVVETTDPQ